MQRLRKLKYSELIKKEKENLAYLINNNAGEETIRISKKYLTHFIAKYNEFNEKK